MSTSVTVQGRTYVSTDLDGSGYVVVRDDTGLPTLWSLFTDLIAEMSSTVALQSLAPSSSGNLPISNGTSWVRSHSSGVTALLDALTVSGASSLQAVTATTIQTSGNIAIGTTPASNVGLFVDKTITASTNAYGTLIEPTLAASANGDGLYALRVLPVYSVGAFTGTTGYGLRIDDVSGAATNIALKTGAGLVQFGDAVTAAAGLTVTANGITVSAGTTSVVNLTASTDIQLTTNNHYLYGITSTSTSAKLIGMDANNVIQLGDTANGFLIAIPRTTGVGATALGKGVLYADTGTAGQLVFLDGVTGARYKLTGTAF